MQATRTRLPLTPRAGRYLTPDKQFKILGTILTLGLLGSQLRKMTGFASRNGSILDSFLEQSTWLDGAALSVTMALSVTVFRQWTYATAGDSAPMNDVLVALPKSRIMEAAAVAAAAFAEDENGSWRAIAGFDASLDYVHRLLRFIFEKNFLMRDGANSSWNRAVFHQGCLVCCFQFLTPGAKPIGLLDMIISGLPTLALRFGQGPIRRLLSIKHQYEADLRAACAEHHLDKFCLLERMVVKPEVQGSGIGTRALLSALHEADAIQTPTLLNASSDRSRNFYKSLGFEVLRETRHTVDGRALTTGYLMLRKVKKLK